MSETTNNNSRTWLSLALVLVLVVVIAVIALAYSALDDDEDDDADVAASLNVSDVWVRATVPQGAADEDMTPSGTPTNEAGAQVGFDEMGADDPAEGTQDASEMPQGSVTGAFMTIENPGEEVEQLVGVNVPEAIARVIELHETTIDDNDVMQMRQVTQIEIPAGETVDLAPGGYHVMLLDVQQALNPGDVVPMTLEFESGKTVTVDAEVREVTGE